MKKISIFIIYIFALISSVNANTGFVGPSNTNQPVNGGFVGPQAGNIQITTVKEISKLFDDTHVIMQGKIINSLGDEKYTFADETGEIIIEIDDEDWMGITVTPETTIQIYGEVDKGMFKRTKIDVDSISVK